MSRNGPRDSVADVVHEGERLHMELLDELRRSPLSEYAGISTELAMFHGQAFTHVYEACAAAPFRTPLTVSVLRECICGLAMYKLWLVMETPLIHHQEYERMRAHWRNVTRLVLTGETGEG